MQPLRKILVVEDEKDLRSIIVALLKDYGHEVAEAANGQEALEMVEKDDFTLILSDINMPVMDGLTFITKLKVTHSYIPVVLITAFGDPANMLKAIRLGAFDFIRKPFEDEEVRSVVDRALEVGFRKREILSAISELPSEQKERISRHDKMVSLIQVNNDKKRNAG